MPGPTRGALQPSHLTTWQPGEADKLSHKTERGLQEPRCLTRAPSPVSTGVRAAQSGLTRAVVPPHMEQGKGTHVG